MVAHMAFNKHKKEGPFLNTVDRALFYACNPFVADL